MINIFKTTGQEISTIIQNEKFSKLFSDIFSFIQINQFTQLETYINQNIDYLTSNEGILNLKKLIEENGEKYYPILWTIFFVSTKKKNYELSKLFSETNNLNEKLLEENKRLKIENIKLKQKSEEQEGIIKTLETENKLLQEESGYLRPNAKAYSEILKILIENNLIGKGENTQQIIQKLINANKISSKLIKWLEKEGIIIKKTNGGYGLSPKVEIIIGKLNKAEQNIINHKTKEEINIPNKRKSNVIKPSNPNIKKYKFKEFETQNKKENLIKDENSDIFAEMTGEFLVEIDNLKQENENKEKKIKEMKQALNEKEKEIERLTKELEDIKKNKGGTTTPAHIVKKAHKSYEENK